MMTEIRCTELFPLVDVLAGTAIPRESYLIFGGNYSREIIAKEAAESKDFSFIVSRKKVRVPAALVKCIAQ